jgi:chromosome segregation ATPase
MVFALGFVLATLLALGVLPAFWRRAYRLSRRDVEAQLPISPAAIAAERDQLRAAFAVELRQVENERERVEALRQADQVELGQRLATIRARMDDIAARDAELDLRATRISELDARLTDTLERLRARERSLEEARETLETLTAAHETLKAAHRALMDVADTRRLEIAALETQLEALRARAEDMQRSLADSRQAFAQKVEEARALDRQARDAEAQVALLDRRLAATTELAEQRAAALSEKDADRQRLRDEVRTLRERLAQREREVSEKERLLALAGRRIDDLDRSLLLKGEGASAPPSFAGLGQGEAAVPQGAPPPPSSGLRTGEEPDRLQQSRRAVETVLAALDAMPAGGKN